MEPVYNRKLKLAVEKQDINLLLDILSNNVIPSFLYEIGVATKLGNLDILEIIYAYLNEHKVTNIESQFMYVYDIAIKHERKHILEWMDSISALQSYQKDNLIKASYSVFKYIFDKHGPNTIPTSVLNKILVNKQFDKVKLILTKPAIFDIKTINCQKHDLEQYLDNKKEFTDTQTFIEIITFLLDNKYPWFDDSDFNHVLSEIHNNISNTNISSVLNIIDLFLKQGLSCCEEMFVELCTNDANIEIIKKLSLHFNATDSALEQAVFENCYNIVTHLIEVCNITPNDNCWSWADEHTKLIFERNNI